MKKSKVDEILENGMYGPKEIKREERRKYLGTIRERIEGTLTTGQIYQKKGYKEVESWISDVKDGEMLLNGDLDYTFLSPYIQLAIQYHFPYTIVENQDKETNIGLVIAHFQAVDKEEIGLAEQLKQGTSSPPAFSLFQSVKKFLKIGR